MLGRILIVVWVVLGGSVVSTPTWAGLKEGVAAYKAGDYEVALRELLPLAEKGNAEAQNRLGVMYSNGWGVQQDNSEALKWYRKAAEQGHAVAQTNLGDSYYLGKFVPQDYKKALKWYRKAAEQGDSWAQYRLGDIYERGQGVPRNDKEALKWYRKAAKHGYPGAAQSVAELERAMRVREHHSIRPRLFGVTLVGATRSSFRSALKQAGVKPLREEESYWCDKYDPNGVLKGASILYACYPHHAVAGKWLSNPLAYVEYTFPSTMDIHQVANIRGMVETKYGPPDRSAGSVKLGPVTYTWKLDGVVLTVHRGWPDTTTYLKYSIPKMEETMNKEIARMEQREREKAARAQSNAF